MFDTLVLIQVQQMVGLPRLLQVFRCIQSQQELGSVWLLVILRAEYGCLAWLARVLWNEVTHRRKVTIRLSSEGDHAVANPRSLMQVNKEAAKKFVCSFTSAMWVSWGSVDLSPPATAALGCRSGEMVQ